MTDMSEQHIRWLVAEANAAALACHENGQAEAGDLYQALGEYLVATRALLTDAQPALEDYLTHWMSEVNDNQCYCRHCGRWGTRDDDDGTYELEHNPMCAIPKVQAVSDLLARRLLDALEGDEP